MAKIILDRTKCIGCGSCVALCEAFFEMAEDGNSHLKEAKADPKTEREELEVSKAGCISEAAEACPVGAIHIK